jgi:hypothetical protein
LDGAGTLSDRWALAAGRAATKGCRICHGPRLPGARLCGPCKAALKRARQETVSEALSPPGIAAEQVKAARRRKKSLPAPPPASPARTRWLLPALAIALPALLAGGYLAQWLAHSAAAHAPSVAVPAPVTTPAPAVAQPPARTVSGGDSAAREAKPGATTPAPTPAAGPHPVILNAPIRPAQKRPVESAAVANAIAAARFEGTGEPAVTPPAPVVEAPPPVVEAPPPDRWQVMSAAIARCGREDFIASVICEQRVRFQYCEGQWGQVPQCPSAVNKEYSR